MKRLAALGLMFPLVTGTVFANQDGTSTATFLRIGQGTRAEGMGGAYTAVADDAHAVYWNPAGLAQITRRNVALNHLEFIEDVNSQYASLVLPANKLNGSLGVGITYVDMGQIERRDGVGTKVGGNEDVTASAATLSWGQALGDRLALGAGIKFIQQDLAGESGSGIATDLGALFFLVPNKLALGGAVLNLGPKIKTGTTDEDIPRTYTGGLAWYAIPGQLLFSVDASKEIASDTILHGGGEYTFQGRYIVRVGYQDTQEAEGGLSAGAGFIWRPRTEAGGTDFFGKSDGKPQLAGEGFEVRIDYAYVDMGDFDATHRLGLHFAF